MSMIKKKFVRHLVFNIEISGNVNDYQNPIKKVG